jgi:hypothetical protein|tara:strand:+ start:87 stop:608 length:522 start_codon:yes stop_codon:yes gene_type:complete
MQIFKDYRRKIEREYFYFSGQLEIDCDYFIKKIKEGCKEKSALNNKTNILGKMTEWRYFINDKKLENPILQIINHVDKTNKLPQYNFSECWGFEVIKGGKTKFHDHTAAIVSGVIYLNECDQPLIFEEINEKIYPKPGAFAVFSPWLRHGCHMNLDDRSKFGLSFNMNEANTW